MSDLNSLLLAMVDGGGSTTRLQQRNLVSDDDSSMDDTISDDPWDHNLMGNKQDQLHLQSLPELEREAILADRAEQRQQLQERRALKQKLKQQHDAQNPSTRSSLTDKKKKMQALKAKHGAKKRRGGGTKYDSSNESEYEQPVTKKRHTSSNVTEPAAAAAVHLNKTALPAVTLEQLRAMQITRDQIEKFCFAEFFHDLVSDAFVRVRVGDNDCGPVYRVGQVVGVDVYKKSYMIQKSRSNLSFRMKHGSSERPFLADVFSNQPFTENEYNRWRIQCENDQCPIPTESDSLVKAKDIRMANMHVFSEHEVAEMLYKKRALSQGKSRNLAIEKAELIKKRQIAQSQNDVQKVAELDLQLASLEYKQNKPSSSNDVMMIKKRGKSSSMLASSMGSKELFGEANSIQNGSSFKQDIDLNLSNFLFSSDTTITDYSLSKHNDINPDELVSITDIYANGPKIDVDLDI